MGHRIATVLRMTGEPPSAQSSLALRRHAERCFHLAQSLADPEAAERMRRLARTYVELADRLDAAAIATASATTRPEG